MFIKTRIISSESKFKSFGRAKLSRSNRLSVLASENDKQRTSHSDYYLPNVELKAYNIMINGENVVDQPIKNNKVTYENYKNCYIKLLILEQISKLISQQI